MTLNSTSNSISPAIAFAGTAVVTGLWLSALITVPGLQNSGISVIVARITVPTSLVLHALSLRQLLRRSRPLATVAA